MLRDLALVFVISAAIAAVILLAAYGLARWRFSRRTRRHFYRGMRAPTSRGDWL
jgi:Flp pilus assembly protein TadB